MTISKFSMTLKKYRKAANLTQKQVAEALGVERSTYAYYETGADSPKISRLIEISKVIGVDYRVFLDAIESAELEKMKEQNNEDASLEEVKSSDMSEFCNSITNDERFLILSYRTLTMEQKAEIWDAVKKMVNGDK